MERIFANSNDREIAAYVLYGKSGKLYSDAACTKQAASSEVAAVFSKARVVVNYDGAVYLAVAFAKDAAMILTSADGKAITPVSLATAKNA